MENVWSPPGQGQKLPRTWKAEVFDSPEAIKPLANLQPRPKTRRPSMTLQSWNHQDIRITTLLFRNRQP
jgi:hypothetical protein